MEENVLNPELEQENEKTNQPQNEEVEEHVDDQETVDIEDSELSAREKWAVIAGYAFIALGILDYCLATFGGIDLTGFKFSPVIFGAMGGAFVKYKDKFDSNRNFFVILGAAVAVTVCVLAVSRLVTIAQQKAFAGQWVEQVEGVTRIFDLKEDKTFVLIIVDDDGSVRIQGDYKIAEGEGNKKCLVMTYDINTLTEPELKDFFEDYNEKVKKAEEEGELYGLIGVRVEGNTLFYDNGSMKKMSIEYPKNEDSGKESFLK